MNAPTIHSLAEAWFDWAVGGLGDGLLALMLAAGLWWGARRHLPARWGMWLFLLVMLKTALPTPMAMPFGRAGMAEGSMAVSGEAFDALAFETAGGADDRIESQTVSTSEPAVPAAAAPALPWKTWLALLWSGGVLAGLGGLVWRGWQTRRLVQQARPLSGEELPESLQPPWLDTLLPAGSEVRESGQLPTPAAWGGRRPCVLLPAGLAARLTPAQLRWTLAHEGAHLRHGDWALGLLQAALTVVCFFNPTVWLASCAASAWRERACDEDAVTLAGAPPKESAAGFVQLIEWSHHHAQAWRPMPGLSWHGRLARWRLRHLLHGVPARRRAVLVPGLLLLGLLACLPSFRADEAEPNNTTTAEVERLKARVAALEAQLQAKSTREARVELNLQRARRRTRADLDLYTQEQLNEIETIYQEARKRLTTAERAVAFAPLFKDFVASNRAGCARLTLAKTETGTAREAALRRLIATHSDCLYLDGTSVGGLARLLLAEDLLAAGRAGEAAGFIKEIEEQFPDHLDHDGKLLAETARSLRPVE